MVSLKVPETTVNSEPPLRREREQPAQDEPGSPWPKSRLEISCCAAASTLWTFMKCTKTCKEETEPTLSFHGKASHVGARRREQLPSSGPQAKQVLGVRDSDVGRVAAEGTWDPDLARQHPPPSVFLEGVEVQGLK